MFNSPFPFGWLDYFWCKYIHRLLKPINTVNFKVPIKAFRCTKCHKSYHFDLKHKDQK